MSLSAVRMVGSYSRRSKESFVKRVGVLRLRGYFASRSSLSAQDDRAPQHFFYLLVLGPPGQGSSSPCHPERNLSIRARMERWSRRTPMSLSAVRMVGSYSRRSKESFVKRVGVLRLRGYFASRSSLSAQDDRAPQHFFYLLVLGPPGQGSSSPCHPERNLSIRARMERWSRRTPMSLSAVRMVGSVLQTFRRKVSLSG